MLTGRASFVDDITLPGTLSAVFVRSPFAHAAVRKIDKSAALALPGVVAVYTLDDLRPHVTSDRTPLGQSVRELVGLATKSLRENIAPFILVRDEVCYVGDPVAVVIAENRYVAEDAAAIVEVDYEPLAAVSDFRAAAKAGLPVGPPQCREQYSRRVHGRLWRLRSSFFRTRLMSSIFPSCSIAAAPIQSKGAASLAHHDTIEDRTTLWTSTQSPHEVRLSLVQLFDVDDEKMRVITPDVGGGFGAKYLIYPEEVVVPLAARLLGRPVKWIEDRREHFLTSIQERDQYWDLQIAFDATPKSSGCAAL